MSRQKRDARLHEARRPTGEYAEDRKLLTVILSSSTVVGGGGGGREGLSMVALGWPPLAAGLPIRGCREAERIS